MDQFYRRFLRAGLAAAGSVLLCGCPTMFPEPLEIRAFGPGSGLVPSGTAGEVWVEFSRPVPQRETEVGVTLEEGGRPVGCGYFWEGNRVTLTTDRGLSSGKTYDLRVAGWVEDHLGINLSRGFHVTFQTRSADRRPTVVISSPVPGTLAEDPFQPVVFQFSQQADRASFYRHLAVVPALRMTYHWGAGDLSCTVVPGEALEPQTVYTLRLGPEFADSEGNLQGAEAVAWFRTGDRGTTPRVLSVVPLVRGSDTEPANWTQDPGLPLAEEGETRGIEGTWGFEVRFDRPVRRAGLESMVSVEPDWAYTLPAAGEWVDRTWLVPARRMDPGVTYTMTWGNAQTYRFVTDGARTGRPSVEALVVTPRSGAWGPVTVPGDHSDDYQLVGPWPEPATPEILDIRLVFRVVRGAQIDRASLLSRFSVVSTDPGTSVSVRNLGVSVPGPEDTQTVDTVVQVVRRGPGLLIIRLGAGAADSWGNTTDRDLSWPLVG